MTLSEMTARRAQQEEQNGGQRAAYVLELETYRWALMNSGATAMAEESVYSRASSCLDTFSGLLSVVCRCRESYAWCEWDEMGI